MTEIAKSLYNKQNLSTLCTLMSYDLGWNNAGERGSLEIAKSLMDKLNLRSFCIIFPQILLLTQLEKRVLLSYPKCSLINQN